MRGARTGIAVEIGHAGTLAPYRETGRVERANERRRARRAEIDGARGDGAVCGRDDRHREVISVHERYCTKSVGTSSLIDIFARRNAPS